MALVPVDPITLTCLAWALKPLERQLGYNAKVGEKVRALAEAMNRLEARSKDVVARIEAAQRVDPTQQHTCEVEDWLQSVDVVKDKVNFIEAKYEQIRCRCLGGCCSINMCANWKIGRKATKELVTLNDLYQRGGDFVSGAFVSVTQAGPSSPGQEMAGTSNLSSAEPNLTKVLGYLADGARTVGIFGMGGVGKTMLLKAINNKLCHGLPLALVVVGRAMSSKHTLHEWKHTLATFKKPQPSSSKSIQEDLFAILKYSYDNLPDETTRQSFLFFVLLQEESILSSDNIILNLWIYDIINTEDCSDLNEIFDRGHYYIGVLKTACLLEPCDKGGRSMLKMHDLIGDMALWITCGGGGSNCKWVVRARLGSNEPLKGVSDWEDAERLSLMSNNITSLSVPTRTCEKLSTLILRNNPSLERIPDYFFLYFPALSCLNLGDTNITELPKEITALVELRFLNLVLRLDH